MTNEEELFRGLLGYRRLLFRRFRLLRLQDLDGAFSLSPAIEEVEHRLRTLVDGLPGVPENAALARLAASCDAWNRRGREAFEAHRHETEGRLFRETADLEIKKFLRKMFPTEP